MANQGGGGCECGGGCSCGCYGGCKCKVNCPCGCTCAERKEHRGGGVNRYSIPQDESRDST